MGDLGRSLAPLRNQAIGLYWRAAQEQKAAIRRWEDEKPSLECVIGSLTQAQSVLKAELANARKKLKKEADEQAKEQAKAEKAEKAEKSTHAYQEPQGDLEDLQLKLVDL